MSHEIYYTSAPEGVKRGTSGFSTVGVSDNIPKALWDRLETLSAYRHEFTDGRNPVSLAHWILNLGGKTHHVLSRICDSGLDHTQRTNAFAHHLVLDHGEIERAVGGPAWMLRQAGVMAESWDGRVGAISRAGLPGGDEMGGSKVCRAWEGVTGDAGWGGHVADLFAKSPTRPVCILFEPGQDVFALMEEAIALLPPAARWNVTFNTYFTSMPTSATCLWRCCLAGTPAAQVGLRYGASGLVLDLTDRQHLPTLPNGPYVTLARTGRAAEGAGTGTVKGAERGGKQTVVEAAVSPATSRQDAVERNTAEYELAAGPAEAAADENEVRTPQEFMARTAAGGKERAAARPARTIRRAEEALEEAEREESRAADRRRKQVVVLFMAALGAIAVGSAIVFFSAGRSAPPPPPTRVQTDRPPVTPVEPIVATPTTVVEPIATLPTEPATRVGVTRAVETAPVRTAPVVVTYPQLVTALAMLERPNIGAGIGERIQTLRLPARELDPAVVTGMKIAFPATSAVPSPAASSAGSYSNAVLGTLLVQADSRGNMPGIGIRWRSPTEAPADVVSVGFNRTDAALEIRWRSAALLRYPASFSFLFWTLQNSVLELDNGKLAGQKIVVKPFVPPAVNFVQGESDLSWPAELPQGTTAMIPKALPEGWKAEWYPDWEVKDPTHRTQENALQVIKITKTTNVKAVDAWFTLTFTSGLKKVQSSYGRRVDSASRDLGQFESDLRAITAQMEEVKARNNGSLGNSQGAIDMQKRYDETVTLVDAYKAAIAGYKEVSEFDVDLGLQDGMRLTTLHFQAQPRTTEAGK